MFVYSQTFSASPTGTETSERIARGGCCTQNQHLASSTYPASHGVRSLPINPIRHSLSYTGDQRAPHSVMRLRTSGPDGLNLLCTKCSSHSSTKLPRPHPRLRRSYYSTWPSCVGSAAFCLRASAPRFTAGSTTRKN